MIYVQEGDAEPKVAIVQILLNRRGFITQVDGYFGPKTRQAVVEFQQQQHLKADGTVEALTWGKLVADSDLGVIDALDFTDMMVPNRRGKIVKASGEILKDLTAAGARPIVSGAMCDGRRDVFGQIFHRSTAYKAIALLRFFGHGRPALIRLSGGEALTLKELDRSRPVLSTITPRFAAFGSVEMHSCSVARGADGKRFLTRLAAWWGVPVTAAENLQVANGSIEEAVRFEGPTFTAYPRGGSLKEWARQFTAVSV